MAAIKAGKNVVLCKPMASSVEQCKRLRDAADQAGVTLIVDHTFIYTGAIRKIRELLASGELGKVLYYDSTRINLGLFQSDVSVLWDLAVHDFAILEYLFGKSPIAVSATGAGHVNNSPENVAYITLFYDCGATAHINVNWMSPVKVRQIIVGGDKKMVVYNDIDPSEKIKIYDKGVIYNDDKEQRYKQLWQYRTGDVWIPNLDNTEACPCGSAVVLLNWRSRKCRTLS